MREEEWSNKIIFKKMVKVFVVELVFCVELVKKLVKEGILFVEVREFWVEIEVLKKEFILLR